MSRATLILAPILIAFFINSLPAAKDRCLVGRVRIRVEQEFRATAPSFQDPPRDGLQVFVVRPRLDDPIRVDRGLFTINLDDLPSRTDLIEVVIRDTKQRLWGASPSPVHLTGTTVIIDAEMQQIHDLSR